MPAPSYQLSVIIPAYNEEKRIRQTLEDSVRFLNQSNLSYEILVINDGSIDKTLQCVKHLAKTLSPHITCINLPHNKGKGFAVKTGLLQAQGEAVLYLDADNAVHISEINKLFPYLESYPIVIGSRKVTNSIKIKQPIPRRLLSFASRTVTSLLIDNVKDTQCSFKLFRNSAAKIVATHQTINRYAFDVELLAIAKIYKLHVYEVGIVWRHGGDSKIRIVRDSSRFLYDFVKIGWNIMSNKYGKPAKS